MKRTPFHVHYGAEVAKFSHWEDAIAFGRFITIGGGRAEVIEPRGIIGQFSYGRATPEFAHLNTTGAPQ